MKCDVHLCRHIVCKPILEDREDIGRFFVRWVESCLGQVVTVLKGWHDVNWMPALSLKSSPTLVCNTLSKWNAKVCVYVCAYMRGGVGGGLLSHSAEQKSISLVNKWGVSPLELFVTMCETAATTEYLHLTQQQTRTHTRTTGVWTAVDTAHTAGQWRRVILCN